jgi:hypothetical protein
MSWAFSRNGEIKNTYEIYLGILKGRDYSENQDVYGRTILKCILAK